MGRGAESFDVVARDKGDVFQQRLESLAMFFLPCEGESAEGASMIRTFEADEAALLRAADAVRCQPSQLETSTCGREATKSSKTHEEISCTAEKRTSCSLRVLRALLATDAGGT